MSRLELTEKVCEQKVKNLEMQMNLLLQRNQDLMMMNKMILKGNNIMFITDITALHDFLIFFLGGGCIGNVLDVLETNKNLSLTQNDSSKVLCILLYTLV